MSRISDHNLQAELERKNKLYSIRVTGFLSGTRKNNFLNDCIYREHNESKMLKNIIDIYYSLMSEYPELAKKEPEEIKKFLVNLVKESAGTMCK